MNNKRNYNDNLKGKQFLKVQVSNDDDKLYIVDTVNTKPDVDDGFIYATIDDIIKVKPSLIKIITNKVPSILKTLFEKREVPPSDTTL